VLVLSGGLIATDYAQRPFRLAGTLALFAAAVVVFGQLLPRAIARRFAPAVAALLSPLLEAAAIVTSPIVAAGRWASRPFERHPQTGEHSDRDTIQDLLREGELEGVGEREEMEIITGVMSFGEKLVRDVMIPHSEIFAIDRSASAREVAEEFATSAFSRVPVYEGTLDHVVGMVHAFDVLKTAASAMPRCAPSPSRRMPRRAASCSSACFRRSQHLALVQDSLQHTVGLVTLEDLLEELVGDIRDEHDEPAPRGEG
jgi:putative hemolysin